MKKIMGILICMLLISSYFGMITGGASNEVAQEQTGQDNVIVVSNHQDMLHFVAQSFIPSKTPLCSVDVYIGKYGYPSSDLTLSIRTDLSGGNLASASRDQSEIPNSITNLEWINFDFTDITVTIGSTYYIVLETGYSDSLFYYAWGWKESGDPYNKGEMWRKLNNDPWEQWFDPDGDCCFKTYTTSNQPPNTPSSPSPSNGATDISTNPTLSVYVSDPDGDTMDVSFYDNYNQLIGIDYDVSSDSRASVTWSGLQYDTTYQWYVIANDGEKENRGPSSGYWSFTTEDSPIVSPTVQTQSATNIQYNSAKLNGKITNDGGEDCEVRFRYKKTGTSSWSYPSNWDGSYGTGQTFSEIISSLDSNTMYDFQAGAKNSVGSDWGNTKQFTTDSEPIDPPSVTTNDATIHPLPGIATLHGTLNDLGEDSSCEVWFVWDTNSYSSWQDYEYGTTHETKYSTGQFEELIGDLSSGVTYHFRAVASNGGGTVQGSDKTFMRPTLALDPEPLDFGEVREGETRTETFEIWNAGDGTLHYDFTWEDCNWIVDVSPTSGFSTGPDDKTTVAVTVDATGLSLGPKSGYISIDIGGLYPYSYLVEVLIVEVYRPPDVTLTNANIENDWCSSAVFLNPFIPLPIDYWLDRWYSIPNNLANAEYNYYGHKADLNSDWARAAVKARYDLDFLDVFDIPLPIPVGHYVEKQIGVTYDVPIINGEDMPHVACFSVAGNYEGEIWIEDLGFATVCMDMIVEEGSYTAYPHCLVTSCKQLDHTYEVGAFFSQDDWAFSGSLSHENDYFCAQVKEGKTYVITVLIKAVLTLAGEEIGVGPFEVGVEGHGWSDIKFNFESVKVEYHNPPPAPPEGEHYPEITDDPTGPENLKLREFGTFTANAIDADGDDVFYQWNWGDGTTSVYSENNQATHVYSKVGIYFVRVRVKDDSEYELETEFSEPLTVGVSEPEGTITITTPTSNHEWMTVHSYDIKWSYTGDIGDEVFITLHKENDPDYQVDITPNPISTSNKKYTWAIPSNIVPGEDYRIVIWNNIDTVISNTFSIIYGQSPSIEITRPEPGYLYASFTGDEGRRMLFFGNLILYIMQDVTVDVYATSVDKVKFTLEDKDGYEIDSIYATSQNDIYSCNFGKPGIGFYKIVADGYQGNNKVASDALDKIFSISV